MFRFLFNIYSMEENLRIMGSHIIEIYAFVVSPKKVNCPGIMLVDGLERYSLIFFFHPFINFARG